MSNSIILQDQDEMYYIILLISLLGVLTVLTAEESVKQGLYHLILYMTLGIIIKHGKDYLDYYE